MRRLHAGHAPAVLAFELANRAYFAASVPDRGDDFFDQFTDRYNALSAEQQARVCAFPVLVEVDQRAAGAGAPGPRHAPDRVDPGGIPPVRALLAR
ncbi:hypothetical protein ACFV4N_35835 [Actinosynnema sp. NPDC059797]